MLLGVACLLALLPLSLLSAGDAKPVAGIEEALSPFSASLSTGYDSLYMFRGVNQLPAEDRGYGSGIAWTALSVSWAPTANDSLTAASWLAFGVDDSDYKEADFTLTYTRTIGDLSLSAGYALYAVLAEPHNAYSNELSVAAAYEFTLGPITLAPGLNYVFTLGPQPDNRGYIDAGLGYLDLRLDAGVPLYRDLVSLAPWAAVGFSFGYNSIDQPDGSTAHFTGTDHVELGLALPISVTGSIEIAPYAAYSRALTDLIGTRRDTFWAGLSITFSF